MLQDKKGIMSVLPYILSPSSSFRGKGANPNIQDESGYTLLHHATLHGQRYTHTYNVLGTASAGYGVIQGGCGTGISRVSHTHIPAWTLAQEPTVPKPITSLPS